MEPTSVKYSKQSRFFHQRRLRKVTDHLSRILDEAHRVTRDSRLIISTYVAIVVTFIIANIPNARIKNKKTKFFESGCNNCLQLLQTFFVQASFLFFPHGKSCKRSKRTSTTTKRTPMVISMYQFFQSPNTYFTVPIPKGTA